MVTSSRSNGLTLKRGTAGVAWTFTLASIGGAMTAAPPMATSCRKLLRLTPARLNIFPVFGASFFIGISDFNMSQWTSGAAIPELAAVPVAAPQPTGGIAARNCKVGRKHEASVWAARAKESWALQFGILPATGPEAGPDKAVIWADQRCPRRPTAPTPARRSYHPDRAGRSPTPGRAFYAPPKPDADCAS